MDVNGTPESQSVKSPLRWVKSSLSFAWGNCVEVAWAASSLSLGNGNCVEVSGLDADAILVRNSRDPEGGTLSFTQAEWDAFIGGVKNDEFDRPAS